MNNLRRRILKRAYREPGLTVGGLADRIGPGGRTQDLVRELVATGYLIEKNGISLSEKGIGCIDSGSARNRARRAFGAAGAFALAVAAVVVGNWLWKLVQPWL